MYRTVEWSGRSNNMGSFRSIRVYGWRGQLARTGSTVPETVTIPSLLFVLFVFLSVCYVQLLRLSCGLCWTSMGRKGAATPHFSPRSGRSGATSRSGQCSVLVVGVSAGVVFREEMNDNFLGHFAVCVLVSRRTMMTSSRLMS